MAMNGSGIQLNENLTELKQCLRDSQQRSIHCPVISLPTWFCLLGYLLTLAVTQTVYAGFFMWMNLRWLMLTALLASSAADWILSGARRKSRAGGSIEQILMIYLLATFGTVIYAENWIFSGMRWASHAAMLVIFLLFLPQIMTSTQARKMVDILKYVMATLLIYSYLRPFVEGIPDTGAFYHGAMGNANTMGHIAFITALLFLHPLFTSDVPRVRFLSGALATAAVFTVWQSGARSSTIALVTGVLLLFYYYRRETQRLAMVSILLGGLAMVTFPTLPTQISQFFLKKHEAVHHVSTALDVLSSRRPIWSAAWEGFKERPLLGWGFGADSTMSKNWEIKLTAGGAVERDAVNDFLFTLEGGGIVGLCSYMLLIYIVLKQRPSRMQRSILQHFSRDPKVNSSAMALYHAHVALFILPTCLLILNQFDNSALSAGNLISVSTWLSAGAAAILRDEMN
jgi:O-antigen ligase